ncbi:MAG: GDSL-type esterase/lipase family protein [Polyangiales bacterium]
MSAGVEPSNRSAPSQSAPARTIELDRPSPTPPSPLAAFATSRPARAIGWFLVLAAVPYAHPKLRSLRLIEAPWDRAAPAITAPLDPAGSQGLSAEYGDLALKEGRDEAPPMLDESTGEVTFAASTIGGKSPATKGSAAAPPIVLSDLARDVGANARAVEDPSGHALDAFYASLARTEKGEPGATTRVAHYGDSLLVSDFMSSTLRRRFQARFGDGGHGWLLAAKPWAWYFHQDVSFWSSEGWNTHRIVNPRITDELYGYGGATFRTREGGIRASFSTAKAEPGDPTTEKQAFGRRASRFDVHYLEQPEGGSFDVLVDGKVVDTVNTRATSKALKLSTIHADDGPHTFDLKTTGSGEVRLFGVALERDLPGVVWDALGVNGARARLLDVIDHAHWAESLRLRDPQLVVLQFGTNESEDTGYPMSTYESTLEGVLREVKDALPNASCLVVGTMDRAGAGSGGLATRPIIPLLSESQRKVAFKVGCAFWDTFYAMGGDGAMGRWSQSKPKLGGGDLTHPTATGAALLGDLLYSALTQGFDTARAGAPTQTPR